MKGKIIAIDNTLAATKNMVVKENYILAHSSSVEITRNSTQVRQRRGVGNPPVDLGMSMQMSHITSKRDQLKKDPKLRSIPVVILTTSKEEEDMLRGYDLGCASYITKPVNFEGLVELMRALGKYWIEFVELPHDWWGK